MQQMSNVDQASCKLVISELDLLVYLGCRIHEKKKKQTVPVTIEIHFKNIPAGANTDEIEDTVCYSTLIKHVQNFVKNKNFNLVEKFSKVVHDCVYDFLAKREYSEALVKVIVHKVISGAAIKGGIFFVYGGE